MSVSMCVSPYLSTAQACAGAMQTQIQRADLLEALLESCQRSSKNPQLPGFGRPLQPYFIDQSFALTGSPQQKHHKEQRTPVKPKSAKKSRGGHSSGNSSEEEGTKKKRGVKAMLKTEKTNSTEGVKTSGPLIKAVHSVPKAATSKIVWAGPTFGMAPALEDIPMPSDFLLAK